MGEANAKKLCFGGIQKYQFKYYVSVLNRLKNQQFIPNSLFLFSIHSSKNDNNENLAPDQSLCFGTHFDDGSKMLAYHQISLKLLFAYKRSYKKSKSVKHRVICSLIRGHQFVKDRGRRSAHPRYEKYKMSSTTAADGYDVSSLFCNYYCSK